MNYSEKNTCICISESLCCSPEIYRTLSINHLLLFSHYVMPNSMRPHGLQHVRLLCLPLVHCFLWWWKISPVILFYRTLFEKKKKDSHSGISLRFGLKPWDIVHLIGQKAMKLLIFVYEIIFSINQNRKPDTEKWICL